MLELTKHGCEALPPGKWNDFVSRLLLPGLKAGLLTGQVRDVLSDAN